MKFGEVLWKPSGELLKNALCNDYEQWLLENFGLTFSSYQELHSWSIQNIDKFWESILLYNDVQYSGSYQKVRSNHSMPGVKWFEGIHLNYAEHVFKEKQNDCPALICWSEFIPRREVSWSEMEQKVSDYQSIFIKNGVTKGDSVAAFLPNCKEATYAFLAAIGLGAIWSSCSPDFGIKSVLDRFEQIKPKVFIGCNGYSYGGKQFEKILISEEIVSKLDQVELKLMVPFLPNSDVSDSFINTDSIPKSEGDLTFERVEFNDPIWVLYSSGTTGIPKAITHSHGGVLLEHYKYMKIHNDVRPGEKFFWYSTTGWMMWNFLQASFLAGATPVVYDGSPSYGGLDMLFKVASEIGLEHFGTSAPFLVACTKKDIPIGEKYNLSALRSIGSTGAPLPPEAFDYVYKKIKSDLWLCSMAGGTDICTAWVGSLPKLPVKAGELQCLTLGTDMESWDENGDAHVDQVGEMVVKQAMPSMPIYFWNDENMKRYRSSYFEEYPGVWRHGDWITIKNDGQVIIFGRSDSTLNRHGVRIGTAEIYRNLHEFDEIEDSLIVNVEKSNGDHFMPLFVKLLPDNEVNNEFIKKVNTHLRKACSPRHVPDAIIQVEDIPKTISGKKMETPVKKILLKMTNKDNFNRDAMKNPESMDWFFEYAKSL